METKIYWHHNNHICAIVTAEKGYKFIDNLEQFCKDYQDLICEAKTGFDSFPFYDKYKNLDIDFYDKYSYIFDDYENKYEYIGCINDNVIDFLPEKLEKIGDYFSPLLKTLRIAEAYDFHDIKDIVCTDKYIVISSKSEVLACSNIKIPFDTNEEQKDFRELLRKKIKSMIPFNECILWAKYGCASSEFFDIENTLFYNIGTSSFNSLLSNDTPIYFEKIPSNELLVEKNTNYRYLYHYHLSKKTNNKFWWESKIISEWEHIPIAKINSTNKATDYFLAIKNNPDLINCFANENQSSLGLKIQVFIPQNSNFRNIANAIKPMIDGIICALHQPYIISTKEVCQILNVDKNIFLSNQNTCLKKRCYITPYRNNVKWDPEDDILEHVFIEPITTQENTYSFSGQLFEIPCYM